MRIGIIVLLAIFSLTPYRLAVAQNAEAIYAKCNSESMAVWYDCKCIADRYEKIRTERGPSVVDDHILLQLRDTCKNSLGIREYKYRNCLSDSFITVPKGADAKQYCQCLAEAFTNDYMAYQGQISEKFKYQLHSKSMSSCRRQLLGR